MCIIVPRTIIRIIYSGITDEPQITQRAGVEMERKVNVACTYVLNAVSERDGRGILREGETKQHSDNNNELHGKNKIDKHTRY